MSTVRILKLAALLLACAMMCCEGSGGADGSGGPGSPPEPPPPPPPPPPVEEPNNAIWMWSADFRSSGAATFESLAGYGINNVLVHEAAVSAMGEAAFLSRVDVAAAGGVKVHLWFTCFYRNGSWVNPINTSTEQFNQPYFDELIARAERYAGYGNIGGIHLDYVRYPGTAMNYGYNREVNGENAITEFCRQISAAVKAVDADILLSAALMNERSRNAYYYGQNARKMSQYIDILMPMVYRYTWSGSEMKDHGERWVSDVTKWFVDEIEAAGTDARVWPGIMTYTPTSASAVARLPSEQLQRDCSLGLRYDTGSATGATGVVLFRYSLVNYFDMTSLYDL